MEKSGTLAATMWVSSELEHVAEFARAKRRTYERSVFELDQFSQSVVCTIYIGGVSRSQMHTFAPYERPVYPLRASEAIEGGRVKGQGEIDAQLWGAAILNCGMTNHSMKMNSTHGSPFRQPIYSLSSLSSRSRRERAHSLICSLSIFPLACSIYTMYLVAA